MTLEEILNKQVDIFRSGVYSGKVWYTTTLRYFLSKLTIKNKDKIDKIRILNKKDEKKAKELKKQELVACTISATFDESRVLHRVKELNGLIAIDIDKDKNIGLDVNKAKKDVISLPFVAMTMLSCRGEGIWCLVPYNKNNDFRETFLALKEDFYNKGYIIDECKDETRLRFVSYDDNILMRKNTEIYNKTIHIDKTVKNVNNTDNSITRDIDYNAKDWILTKEDLKDITVAVYLLTNFCGYTSDKYDEWLLDGFRLATIPNKEIGIKLFTMISKNSDNFKSIKDVEDKFEECCKTTKYRTNILGYYINKIKEYYGLEWRIKANELLGKNTIS